MGINILICERKKSKNYAPMHISARALTYMRRRRSRISWHIPYKEEELESQAIFDMLLWETTKHAPQLLKYAPRALHSTAIPKPNGGCRKLQSTSMRIWMIIIAQELKLVEDLSLNNDKNNQWDKRRSENKNGNRTAAYCTHLFRREVFANTRLYHLEHFLVFSSDEVHHHQIHRRS